MGAYHNALREEGSRSDLLVALEKSWTEAVEANEEITRLRAELAKAKNDLGAAITAAVDGRAAVDAGQRIIGLCDCIMDERGELKERWYTLRGHAIASSMSIVAIDSAREGGVGEDG